MRARHSQSAQKSDLRTHPEQASQRLAAHVTFGRAKESLARRPGKLVAREMILLDFFPGITPTWVRFSLVDADGTERIRHHG